MFCDSGELRCPLAALFSGCSHAVMLHTLFRMSDFYMGIILLKSMWINLYVAFNRGPCGRLVLYTKYVKDIIIIIVVVVTDI